MDEKKESRLISQLSYDKKENIADAYLMRIAGTSWNSLADINSLHNYETIEEIYAACDDRLAEDGFPFDD